MENKRYFEEIRSYFKEEKQEERAKESILAWSRNYLQLLLEGIHKHEAEGVAEETEQIAYVRDVCERYLKTKDVYSNLSYLAGILVGESRVGSAWLREQMSEETFRQNMRTLLSKAHIKDILRIIYYDQGIQHKKLARLAGVKTNYLSQLIAQLEQVKCVHSIRTGKCTFYELTLRGSEYAKENVITRPTAEVQRNFFAELKKYKADDMDWNNEMEKTLYHPVWIVKAREEERKKEIGKLPLSKSYNQKNSNNHIAIKTQIGNCLRENDKVASKIDNIIHYPNQSQFIEN